MTAHAIAWMWWIIGTFGLAGLVAFWFFVPVAARLALQAVVRLSRLLLSTRIGCAVLAAIAIGLLVDYRRHAYDDAQFAKRSAAFEQAQKDRDARIERDTRDLVWSEIANATADNVVIETDVKEFTDAPAPPAPANDPYDIAAADRIRLCRIAGKTDCGSRRPAAVQAPRRAAAHSAHRQLPQARPGGTR